jgi:hypothetical protein
MSDQGLLICEKKPSTVLQFRMLTPRGTMKPFVPFRFADASLLQAMGNWNPTL